MNKTKNSRRIISEARREVRSAGSLLSDHDLSKIRRRVINRLSKEIFSITELGMIGELAVSVALENACVHGTSGSARRTMIARFALDCLGLGVHETARFVTKFYSMETTFIAGLHRLARFPHKKLIKLLLKKDVNSHDFIESLWLAGALHTEVQEEERMEKALSKFNKYTKRKDGKVYTFLIQGAEPDEIFRDIGPAIALVAAIKKFPVSREFDDKLIKLGYKLTS